MAVERKNWAFDARSASLECDAYTHVSGRYQVRQRYGHWRLAKPWIIRQRNADDTAWFCLPGPHRFFAEAENAMAAAEKMLTAGKKE